MEDTNRRERYFRPLHSLGSDEYSFGWSRVVSRTVGRDQRRGVRFRMCAGGRSPSSHAASRCTAGGKEEQISVADTAISQAKDGLGEIDISFRRQPLARKKAKAGKYERN